ncbi:hypothetical protein NECAME_16165 [Necator americanus]|uniref:Uncharacterized protein n=1 Tax=Necator americanus TaxID=51031 RepID=W2TXB2_NECAM|nr:hypothetical protein NECAME_16165 [Necator americanus]ETN86730.1 hypothetical protein NECAME_16165 [Necator americanus]
MRNHRTDRDETMPFIGRRTYDSGLVGGLSVLVSTSMAMNIYSIEQLGIGSLRMRRCGPAPTLIIFVAYAPKSSYEEEVEAFYTDLKKFYREDHVYKGTAGDFNADWPQKNTWRTSHRNLRPSME